MTRVALIAHDEKKADLIEFAQAHEEQLREYDLLATGTTGGRLQEETDLDVERKESGPLGGDLLRDPLRAQPHEPDISALLRICDVHDTALATNLASATFLLEGLAK